MHFSSPSGQRLSWCRPWKRGAVGCFSKGYCSVTTFLNMVRKVTPKPATGSQNCSLRVLGPVDDPVEGGGDFGSAIDVLLSGHAVVVGRGGLGGHGRADGRSTRRGTAEDQRRRRSSDSSTRRQSRDREAAGDERSIFPGCAGSGLRRLLLVLAE